MFLKLVVVVLGVVSIGAIQLDLRQQRLEAMHEMAQVRDRMDLHRRQTWDLQVRIAKLTGPIALRHAITRAQLTLQPEQPGSILVPPAVARGDWP